MSRVACVAISVARQGCDQALEKELLALVGPTLKEHGVINYAMHRDLDDPRRFVCIELWQDRASFDAHCNAPHVQEYLRRASGLIEHSEYFPLGQITAVPGGH